MGLAHEEEYYVLSYFRAAVKLTALKTLQCLELSGSLHLSFAVLLYHSLLKISGRVIHRDAECTNVTEWQFFFRSPEH